MRRLFFFLALVAGALPACRRPPPPSAQPAFTPAPAPRTAEEPEAEPEPAEPAPPPPAKPSSPPPAGEAGFRFGLTRKEAMNACSTRAVWRREGTNYACTEALEDPGIAGSPVLSFCDDQLCAIGVAHVPEAGDWASWNQAFEKTREALVARHGAPTATSEQIPDDCKNDQFVQCLDAGRAHKEVSWQWDRHLVSLRMSKKKSGDGPSAIRFVSIPKAGAAAADEAAP